jgi:hypothetical protein
MARFTIEERKLLIKNINTILKYIRTEISPYLREFQIVKFEDNPSYREIMLIVDPGKDGKIEFTRGYNSTQYFINDEFDSKETISDRRYRRSFFESFDEMYAFINDWHRIKMILTSEVEKNKSIKNNLENFQV